MNLDDEMRVMSDEQTISVGEAPDGLGLKAHIETMITTETTHGVDRVFIQLYTQQTVPAKPSDRSIGYTSADVITDSGVIVLHITSCDNPPTYVGETIPAEEFVNDWVTDSRLQHKMTRVFEKLTNESKLIDDWLRRATSSYHDRLVSGNWITNMKSVC